jgi:hypothetical protein
VGIVVLIKESTTCRPCGASIKQKQKEQKKKKTKEKYDRTTSLFQIFFQLME